MSITSGVGLVSGLDISGIVDQLISIEARPKVAVQRQNAVLTAQQTAYQTVNAQLLAVKSAASGLSNPLNFRKATGSSSNEAVLDVAVTDGAIPGNYQMRVRQLVAAQQTLTQGQSSRDEALGINTTFTIDRGESSLKTRTFLDDLNGGEGIERGMIRITDRSGSSELVDLSDAVTLDDVVEAINSTVNINVQASLDGQALSIADDTGLTTTNFRIQDVGLTDTATSLGVAQNLAADTITGSDIRTIGRKTAVASLNDDNGVGIKSGLSDIRVTDRDGTTHDINLDGITTVDDLIDTFDAATGGAVTLDIAADGVSFEVTDTTGGAGSLTVATLNSSTAATDLGIEGTIAGATLSGERTLAAAGSKLLKNLNGGRSFAAFGGSTEMVLKSSTQISTLLSGAGLTTTGDSAADIEFTSRQGAVLETTTLLSNLLSGAGLTTTGDGNSDLDITTRDGTTYGIDLDSLTTVQEFIDEVSSVSGGNVSLEITEDGEFELNDLSGSTTGNFIIADAAGASVATELGIALDDPQTVSIGDAVAVDQVPYGVDLDGLTTVQELIDAVEAGTNGNVILRINGNQLVAEDTTGETGLNLVINDAAGSSVATELGLVYNDDESSVAGADLSPAVIDTGSQITLTDSSGASTTVDFAAAESVVDLIDLVNGAGLGIEASLNNAGNGLLLTDTANGSGDLVVADTAGSQLATQLGLAGTFAGGEANSGNLNFGYMRESSSLDALGVTLGSFRLTDSSGASAVVNLTNGNESSIDDVISEINSRGLFIQARVNDAGNGLVLEDTNTGTAISAMTVEEDGSSTAESLGILGTAGSIGANLSGSLAFSIDIDAEDTLSDIASKISSSDANIAGSVLNDGSGASPFRLSLTARTAGSGNAFVFDDGGSGFNAFNLSESQDAVVFMGSGSGSQANSVAIVSGSNTVDGLLPGVTLTLKATTDTPVQVTVNEDLDAITGNLDSLVSSINNLVDTIDQYDAYNADTEERGLLLGDSAINQVKSQILSMVFSRNTTLSQDLDSLTEIGVRVENGGRLSFDESKFLEAFADDRDAVINLMTLRETTTVDEDNDGEPDLDDDGREIELVTAQGFGYQLKDLLERLTDTDFGPIEAAVNRVQAQISNNDERIESYDERLDIRRELLTNEFIQMERVLSQLQTQSQSLAAFQPLQIQSSSNNNNN